MLATRSCWVNINQAGSLADNRHWYRDKRTTHWSVETVSWVAYSVTRGPLTGWPVVQQLVLSCISLPPRQCGPNTNRPRPTCVGQSDSHIGQCIIIIEDSRSHSATPTTLGGNPLDEWSARRSDLYLTTHNTHNRHTSMSLAGSETGISAGERPETNALDGAATESASM